MGQYLKSARQCITKVCVCVCGGGGGGGMRVCSKCDVLLTFGTS